MPRRDLLTEYGEVLDKSEVLSDYPRPQFKRNSFINLNGEWDYAINKDGAVPTSFLGKVLVPFAIESRLSGVGRTLKADEYLFYRKVFEVNEESLSEVTILHLDAVDCLSEVFFNGVSVGSHVGGYLPAEHDVSSCIRVGENELIVKVKDCTDPDYPTGKQRKKRGGIWYTPISGIWQTVWLESMPYGYIESIVITPNVVNSNVMLQIASKTSGDIAVEVSLDGRRIFYWSGRERTLIVPIKEPKLWSPEHPILYDITINVRGDEIKSYFAMREFSVDGNKFLLNGEPYFINGLLDQGYFSDGIYTPASYKAFYDDIAKMKALGFNTLRKHIKIEPLIYYHYCDRIGMLVFQDMVNVGRYSFFKDSVLPFSGLAKKLPYVNVNEVQQANFTKYAVQTVDYLFNCPCVVYYTIFNEGWGQFDGDGLYRLLKQKDPTRVFDATSGWYKETLSDVDSLHIYFRPIKLKKSEKTLIVSEFGGYSCEIEGHVFNPGKSFGYRSYKDVGRFEDAFVALYKTEVMANLKNGLSGVIYTQLSDVEDETNGLLTYDRRVQKVDTARISALMSELYAAAACNNSDKV